MQLSVIQCNCAVRVLEALAPLAPEYVNDKLVILTVRNPCTCSHEPLLTQGESRIRRPTSPVLGGFSDINLHHVKTRDRSRVVPAGADAQPAGQGARQYGGRHRAAAGADRREAQRQARTHPSPDTEEGDDVCLSRRIAVCLQSGARSLILLTPAYCVIEFALSEQLYRVQTRRRRGVAAGIRQPCVAHAAWAALVCSAGAHRPPALPSCQLFLWEGTSAVTRFACRPCLRCGPVPAHYHIFMRNMTDGSQSSQNNQFAESGAEQ